MKKLICILMLCLFAFPAYSGVLVLQTIQKVRVIGEVPGGSINSVNDTFTVTTAPNPQSSLVCFLNGLRQRNGGVDLTLTVSSIVFIDPPETGDNIYCDYEYTE